MKSDWLTATSFERTFQIVSAINTLLIHAKLALAGMPDPASEGDLAEARDRLVAFLNQFQTVLEAAEQRADGMIVGADPRLTEFALHFVAERQRLPQRASLYTRPLPQVAELVQSEQAEDLPELVACLQALRALFEQHSHADIVGLFRDK